MSGGAYNYAYQAIDSARHELEKRRPGHPLQEPLQMLSEALYALEWEDSADTAEGSSDKVVAAFLGRWRPAPVPSPASHIEEARALPGGTATDEATSAEGHRWSGWPGAYCLNCFAEDPHEQCLADDSPERPCYCIEGYGDPAHVQSQPCRVVGTPCPVKSGGAK